MFCWYKCYRKQNNNDFHQKNSGIFLRCHQSDDPLCHVHYVTYMYPLFSPFCCTCDIQIIHVSLFKCLFMSPKPINSFNLLRTVTRKMKLFLPHPIFVLFSFKGVMKTVQMQQRPVIVEKQKPTKLFFIRIEKKSTTLLSRYCAM